MIFGVDFQISPEPGTRLLVDLEVDAALAGCGGA